MVKGRFVGTRQCKRRLLPSFGHATGRYHFAYENIITQESGKRGGRPCIRGMRIAVADVLGLLAAGMSHAEIIADFPELTEEDIRAALAVNAAS